MSLAREGLFGVYSAAPFFAKEPPAAALLLSYTALGEADIREGIRRLATALPAATR